MRTVPLRRLVAVAAAGAAALAVVPPVAPAATTRSVATTRSAATTTTRRAATTAPRATTTRATAAATTTAPAAVTVTFDTPGATPRPLRERVVALRAATPTLRMAVRSITYPGIVCGFTFRGTRPPSPVTIRVSGSSPGGRFDSGALAVSWTASADPQVRAGGSTDARSGWSFSAFADTNRNGPGWVVSVGGVPLHKEKAGVPTAASCTITAGRGATFSAANGPVGYWAGFATA